MKNLLLTAAVACTIIANAATVTLHRGVNRVNERGQIAAAEIATVGASQTVTVSQIVSITDWTNAYRTVISVHPSYSFVITNFDGNACISTNVPDTFSYADWVWTNGESRIVGNVTTGSTSVTNTVAAGQLPGESYTKTNALISATASGHFAQEIPETPVWFADGDILVTGGDDDDRVTIIIR